MVTNHSIFLTDESATEIFGRRLSAASQGHGLITLSGDLGTGKTTLSRGLIRAFGHSGAVKSPTYTIVEPYQIGSIQIMHFDLYRLEDPEELEFLGFRDYLDDNTLCLIEWPEKARSYLSTITDLALTLKVQQEGRSISWKALTPHGRSIAQHLNKLISPA